MEAGSSRVVTTNTGVVCGVYPERSRRDADFYPYGGESAITNNCPTANKYKFEGRVSGFVLANPEINNARDDESPRRCCRASVSSCVSPRGWRQAFVDSAPGPP